MASLANQGRYKEEVQRTAWKIGDNPHNFATTFSVFNLNDSIARYFQTQC